MKNILHFLVLLLSLTISFSTNSLESPDSSNNTLPKTNIDSQTSRLSNQVFEITCTRNNYDFLAPYRPPIQSVGFGTGFIIEGNKIITNAHVVTNAFSIKIRKSNQSKSYKAKVEFIGHDCDLAILRVDDPEFFNGLEPFKLAEPAKINLPIEAYGFPVGGSEITVTTGVISRIQLQRYVHSGIDLLAYQIDAAINPGNSGGPALSKGKVVGVVHQGHDQGQNINYIIPVEILKHFLKDCESGTYRGFPAGPFMYWQLLENEGLRKYLNLSPSDEGVRISWVASDSYAKNLLKPNDVIKTIDGVKIQKDGMIVENDLLLPFRYLYSKKYIGEEMKLEVLREGKTITVKLPLQLSLLELRKFMMFTHSRPKYYILGGLVFQPYTYDYYYQAKRYNTHNLNRLFHLIDSENDTDERLPEHVILSRQLSDDINESYNSDVDAVITTANGKTIHTLQDLINAIDNNTLDYHLLTTNTGSEILFYKKDLEEANKKILENYQIPLDRYL